MKGQNKNIPGFKEANESFDLEFMMPPDIMSIDDDISKLNIQNLTI